MAKRAAQAEPLVKPGLLRDFAQWVKTEYQRRKTARHDLELIWNEVDLQVAMLREPRVAADGMPAEATDWLPELDLPLQAEGLEVLVTDARNLLFADGGKWFRAHAALTDDYLKRWDKKPNIVGGDDIGIPSRLTQAGADAITRAALDHFHRGYDFQSRWDVFNAEAFKYGTAAMRMVLARLDLQDDATYGDKPGMLAPIAVPSSIKNLYLDDATMHATHEGHVLRPGHIRRYWQKLVDLKLAAKLGKDSLGWNPEAVEQLTPRQDAGRDKDQPQPQQDPDSVLLLEWEGDLTHVMGADSIYAPNLVLTIAVGAADPAVVRVRENPMPFCSYAVQRYQVDDASSPYGRGPLMKGVPIQKAASEALNDFMQAADLRARPPVSYNPSDPWLAKSGGPRMEPGAQWPALTEPKMHNVGDPTVLLEGVKVLIQQYQDFTGVNAVRLGASTQTHKSAYAVNQETIRGQIRTVDYVRSLGGGAMLEWLNKELRMARRALKGQRRMIWVEDYKGYVEIDADHLPDIATFDVIGASGPQEEAQETQLFLGIAKALVEMEPLVRQLHPDAKPLDVDVIREDALRRANVEDVSRYFGKPGSAAPLPAMGAANAPAGVPAAAPVQPAIPGAAAVAPGRPVPSAAVVPIGRR